mmetsp:Transcript_15039/g.39526  ORF Transcript_15039/g.39526 Transcript_15039/m.39526 type:complete len:365 (+) Transcript_15039:317-1411(+)
MPGVLLGVAHSFSPCLVVSVRHAGVPVAVVDQDANMLIEQRVRIARQVRAGRRVVDLRTTNRPLKRLLDNVERLDDFRLVDPRSGGDRVDARVRASRAHLCPGCVLARCSQYFSPGLLLHATGDALAKHVVNIDVAHLRVHSSHRFVALGREITRIVDGDRPVANTVDRLFQVVRDKGVAGQVLGLVVGALGAPATCADLVARASVADSDALEWGAGVGAVKGALDDGLSQGGHINASVGLARDEEVVGGVLREQGKELLDGCAVVSGGLIIIRDVVGTVIAVREAHARRRLEVYHCGLLGPCCVVVGQLCEVIRVDVEGAVLIEVPVEGRASRAAIEPEDDWVGRGIAFALDEPVVEMLGRAG